MMAAELHSWKEIADYLGVTVRTAQRWEKEQCLPVRRLPGERGRVLSLVSDLENWKRSRLADPQSLSGDRVSAGLVALLFKFRRLVVSLAALILISALAAGYRLLRPGQPALWRVEGAWLIVSDARNRQLWRWEADYPFASYATAEFNEQKRFVWIGDLDADGDNETLVVPRPEFPGKAGESIPLICLDSRGKERWTFKPGRKVSSGRETFTDMFIVDSFRVAPMGKGRPNSILAVSHQIPDYPCQVSLLDIASGKPVREYWHSGQFSTTELADLDHDGIMEIYLTGANNAHFTSTLVVLDPDRFEGASIEKSPDYQLQGFAPGREIRRVILPRTCLDIGKDIGAVTAFHFVPDGVMVSVAPSPFDAGRPANLDYYFSPAGRLRRMSPSNNYLMQHEAAYHKGALDHAFSHEELRAIEQTVIVLPPSYELEQRRSSSSAKAP